jgi:hypothetical protein
MLPDYERILAFQLLRILVADGIVPSLHFWSERSKMQGNY